MPHSIQEERLRWVLPIIRKELRIIEAAKVCPCGKRSLERWVAAYRKGGAETLVPRSTRPKTQPGETSIQMKEQIIGLRKQTKLCARKLA